MGGAGDAGVGEGLPAGERRFWKASWWQQARQMKAAGTQGRLGVLLDRGMGVPTQVTLAPAEARPVIISAHSADYRD